MDYSEQIKRLVDFSRINAYAGHWEDSEFFTEVKKTLEKLIHENEQLRNEHLKIQYDGEELTVQELCKRLERAEHKKELALQDIPQNCETCWHLFYTVKGQRCEKEHKVQEFNCIYVMKKCQDWKWRGEDWRGTVFLQR